MDHYLIVDGSNLLFQMFYGMPERIIGKRGKPIQAVVGFLGALLRIIRTAKPTHICVCFDGECYNERKDLDAEYKANRPDFSQMAEEDIPYSQLGDIYAALDYLGICHRETESCEADDWIAGFALTYGKQGRVTVVSQDSDFFQLITENVSILRYRGDNSVLCDSAYIQQRLGITPGQYAEYKSLTGDASDNIKGVTKVGAKTAAELLRQFGSLEGILENLQSISRPSVRAALETEADRLLLNRKLIQLKGTQCLPFSREEMAFTYCGQNTGQILSALGIR